jgi:hypothetical protein
MNAKAGTETLMAMLSGNLPTDLRDSVLKQLYKIAEFDFLPSTAAAASPSNLLPSAGAAGQMGPPPSGANQTAAVSTGAACAGNPNPVVQFPGPAMPSHAAHLSNPTLACSHSQM